jgi:hypothetical protein
MTLLRVCGQACGPEMLTGDPGTGLKLALNLRVLVCEEVPNRLKDC